MSRLRDQLNLATRHCQQERHRLGLCLHGTFQLSLLVTSVSLVSSCNKKWTCPPDNHVRTFRICLISNAARGFAADRTEWRSPLKQHLETEEEKLMAAAADKRARRKQGSSSIRPETTHRCDVCNKDCHSRIGLFSHKRRCSNPARN